MRELEQAQAEITALRAEVERLKVESIQMKFALGYLMPADLERHILPSNPFKCGVCDARRQKALDDLFETDAMLLDEEPRT
jgi:hypothetical protein